MHHLAATSQALARFQQTAFIDSHTPTTFQGLYDHTHAQLPHPTTADHADLRPLAGPSHSRKSPANHHPASESGFAQVHPDAAPHSTSFFASRDGSAVPGPSTLAVPLSATASSSPLDTRARPGPLRPWEDEGASQWPHMHPDHPEAGRLYRHHPDDYPSRRRSRRASSRGASPMSDFVERDLDDDEQDQLDDGSDSEDEHTFAMGRMASAAGKLPYDVPPCTDSIPSKSYKSTAGKGKAISNSLALNATVQGKLNTAAANSRLPLMPQDGPAGGRSILS
jgi:hypothetical protein